MASFRKHGDSWQARVRRQGYPEEVKSFTTKTEAQRWARAIEGAMDRGTFVSRAEAEQTTLGAVIQRYVQIVSPRKRGHQDEVIRLNAMLRHRITKMSMANLTPQAVADYRDERLRTCQANTVIRDLAMLSAIINHARNEWGMQVQNPVMQVRKPAMPPGRDRVLSADEEQCLLTALAPTRQRNPFMHPLVIFAIETAMRRGEILNLRKHHLDLPRRVAFLPMTKNGQPRHVPLSLRAIETVQQLPPSPDDRLFPIGIAAMEANFLRAVKRSGLHNLHFHDLRHTATSRMAQKLPNVIELAAVTGHTSLQMLKRYYHPQAEALALKLG